jgi:hypothetical protein
MRKTLGICVTASLALWLGGCGDDDDACTTTCGEPDAAVTDTDPTSTSTSSSSTSRSTASSSSSQTAADSGSSEEPDAETPSSTDAGSPDADVDIDSGSPVDAATPDGGTVDGGSTDAGSVDGGDVELTACEQACATAEAADCVDNSTCSTTGVCGIQTDSPEECLDEAAEYLLCVAAADPSEFACEDDQPTYTGDGCNEALFTWIDCTN